MTILDQFVHKYDIFFKFPFSNHFETIQNVFWCSELLINTCACCGGKLPTRIAFGGACGGLNRKIA